MQVFAENLEFEKAQRMKEKLDLLEKYQAKSLIASPSIANHDVCTIVSDEKNAYVNYMRVKNGAMITSKNRITCDESQAATCADFHPCLQSVLSVCQLVIVTLYSVLSCSLV